MIVRNRCLVGILVSLIAVTSSSVARADDAAPDAHQLNKVLGRGINLGNILDAPREGAWGLSLKAEYFGTIKDAGFDSVRIPIRWSTHAEHLAPFTINPKFFERVDWAIDQALSHGLAAVINVHHYEELFQDPDANSKRLLALWDQIGKRYRDKSDKLFFELLNEPHANLTDQKWQAMIGPLLKTVRESNPNRIIIIGPGHWNSYTALKNLILPDNDRRLILTFHYYVPMRFTHQGAHWERGSMGWLGTPWPARAEDTATLQKDFQSVAQWAKQRGLPVYLGEFGSYSAADMPSRCRWTSAVVQEAERHGFSWAYWEFGSGFGAYDPIASSWRQPLLDALIQKR